MRLGRRVAESAINRWTDGTARTVCCDVSGAASPEERSCSTMDSASVSEAGDLGSIPSGSTNFRDRAMTAKNSPFLIRKARGFDAESIQRLYASLVKDPAVRVSPEQVERMFSSSRSYLLVYEEGGVHGTALLSLCDDAMYQMQPFGIVENIVVSDSMRGKGIGSRLLEFIDAVCRETNCSKIMLSSSAVRTDAHRFFVSHGYNGDLKKGFVKYRKAFSKP